MSKELPTAMGSALMAVLALCMTNGLVNAQYRTDGVKLPGSYYIGSVMPVRVPSPASKCGTIDVGALLRVEAMMYAVRSINKRSGSSMNGTLGLDIRETCDGTYQAMLDLVVRTQPGGKNPSLFAVVGNLPANVKEYQNSLMLLLSREITHVSCDSSSVSSNNYISESDKIFHVSPSEGTSVEAMADLISNYNWSYVGVITDSNARPMLAAFRKEASGKNICVGASYTVSADVSDKEIAEFIRELSAEKNYSIVALFSSHGLTKRILAEASRQKVMGVTWVMGQRSWPNTAPISLPNKAAQGMFTIETHTSLTGFADYLRGLPTGGTKIENRWLRELAAPGALPSALPTESTNSSNATKLPPTPSPTPCDYEAEPLCGIDKKNLDIIVKQMLDRIEEAACTLDAVATVAKGLVARVKCQNSSYCPQGRGSFNEFVQGLDFVNSLTEHQISFSKRGFLKQTKYRVYNYQQNYSRISTSEMTKLKAVDVGVWSQSPAYPATLRIDQDRVEWHAGVKKTPTSRCHEICPEGKFRSHKKVRYGAECCWECAKCPEMTYSDTRDTMACKKCPENHRPNLSQRKCVAYFEDYVHWEHPGALVMLFLMVVGICFSLYIAFVLFRHGDTPIVRKAKSAILGLIPFVVILFLLPIPLLSKPTESSCEGYRLFFLFSLGIPLAVLISRSQYFDDKCFDPVNGRATCTWKCCGPRALVTSFVIALHIILAIVLCTQLPAKVDRLPTDDPFTVFLECNYHSSYEFLVVIFYTMLLAVLVTIFSFNEIITEENNYEVKWISMAIFNWYTITFFYVVFEFGLDRKPKIVLLALMCFFYAVNLLVFLYLPKWYVVIFQPDKNRSDVSPWTAYMKNQEKVSERLSAPEESPVMSKRGLSGASGEKPEAQGLISDTDI